MLSVCGEWIWLGEGRDGWGDLFMDGFKGMVWYGAVKGKGGEQTGCGMLRMWGVHLVGGGKGWVG